MIKIALTLISLAVGAAFLLPTAVPTYSIGTPTTTYPVIFALDSAGITTVYDTTSVSIFGYNPDTATAFQNRAITEQRNYDATH